MSTTGIYILTYPGDYHLALALIESLRHFAPAVPVMVIPGVGVDRDDHPFDVPLMPEPDGFWAEMEHYDRKFWAFQGPFERFVYLDADVICTRPLKPLIERIEAEPGPFLMAHIRAEADEWHAVLSDPTDPRHAQYLERVPWQLGHVDRLREFDREYSPYAHYPFNAGVFASRRLTIGEGTLEDLYAREAEFLARRLNKPFRFAERSLFFGDQGRLNYLVEKLGIELRPLAPYGHFQWGGDPFSISVEAGLGGEAPYTFIHWAGTPVPSPSVFCHAPLLRLFVPGWELPPAYGKLRELPGYSLWRHFLDRWDGTERWDNHRLGGAWRWSLWDARRIVRFTARRARKRGRRFWNRMRTGGRR
jgi:hypothetical protein